MNKGFRGFPRPRNRVFVGIPQTINVAVGNYFYHGLGHVPGEVHPRFVCAVANNGYVMGQEIPFEAVFANDGNNDDGGPYRVMRYDHESVLLWLGSTTTYAFFPGNATPILGNIVAFTLAQWKVTCRCRDIERLT